MPFFKTGGPVCEEIDNLPSGITYSIIKYKPPSILLFVYAVYAVYTVYAALLTKNILWKPILRLVACGTSTKKSQVPLWNLAYKTNKNTYLIVVR